MLQEISKSNVVDDMVASNPLLYKPGEHPDHVVVIKCAPSSAPLLPQHATGSLRRERCVHQQPQKFT